MFRRYLIVAASVTTLLAYGSCETTRRQSLPTAKVATPEEPAKWPRSAEQAVDRLMTELPAKEKRAIHAMKKDDLIVLHFGLGLYIRNFYGLWRGNQALMQSTH